MAAATGNAGGESTAAVGVADAVAAGAVAAGGVVAAVA